MKEIGRVSCFSLLHVFGDRRGISNNNEQQLCCTNFLEGIEGFCMAPLTRVLDWSTREVAVLLANVRKESTQHNIHGWQKGIVAYGRKPLARPKV